ncbi:hypothetical protein MKK88_05870 [Methylobacterium sp. E-005]|uniref:hypothetical protein n=1 Tax=Methylobacterium sp. E-005 TaxID=2836549 RepID=UPI001FB9CCF7|nr:hypothetical protein [Methylobacterium sp. E-005]MCJ2085522.1 hypothetical protein [Methylobacterium sp. E-005]
MDTHGKRVVGRPFEAGNPGRPKGARNKLSEAFAEALHADFQQHGVEAIQRMREEEPAQYVRTIASLLPKDVRIESAPLAELSDDELGRLIDVVRTADGASAQPGGRALPSSGPKTAH